MSTDVFTDVSTTQQSELGWGRRHLWLRHSTLPEPARREYNISLRYEPPAGSTVDGLRRVLDHLVARHEALRTTYHEGDGGGPVQRVHPPAPFPVEHVETGTQPGGSPAGVVNAVTAAEFDLARDLPVRALLVTTAGVPTLLLIVVHHTAMDDWCIKRFHHELEAANRSVTAGEPVDLPPVAHHPSDLVAHERSPAGRRAHAAALRHWDGLLAGAPASTLVSRRVPQPGEPVAHAASLTSPDVATAARTLAVRYGVWPNQIYTAGFTALLTACAGQPGVAFRTYAANRDSAEQASLMSSLSQPVPVAVPYAADAPFADVVAATARHTAEALRHSWCAYDEALELTARRGAARGVALHPGVFYNHLSYAPAVCGARRTRFTRSATPTDWALERDDLYFRVHEYRDAVVISLSAQATALGADDVERFLRGVETLLVEQAASGEELRISQVTAHAGFAPAAAPAAASPVIGSAEQQRALADAVGTANGIADVDPARSYVTAGGRLLNVPLLRRRLHEHGWTGLELHHTTGITPLREVAAALHPIDTSPLVTQEGARRCP